jgi:predicted transcriptional regulator
MLITPDQVRAARALLRIDQTALARQAGISVVTLRRLEDPNGLSKVAPATVERVRGALEDAGAEFVERGVRHAAGAARPRDEVMAEVDRIVAEAAALFAEHPPFAESDLYDENGL